MAGKKQSLAPMWKKLMKNVDIDEPTSFLDHVYLGCTQRECKPNETIIEQYTRMFETHFCWGNKQITGMAETARTNSSVVLRHGGTCSECVERYWELANKKVEQLYKVSHPCLDDQQFKHIVRSLLANCLEVPVPGTIWTTWHPVVREQTCKISHKTDAGMWQTMSKADFINSSHEWLSSIVSCGEHNTALQIWVIPRLRLCWRPWGLKINLRWCLMYVWKSNFRPNELDVQETNNGFAQFYRIWGYFSGYWTTYGWVDLWDIVIEVVRSTTDNIQPKHTSHQETGAVSDSKTKTQQVTRKQKVDQLSEVDHVPTNTHSSQGESQLCIFEDNEAVIKLII